MLVDSGDSCAGGGWLNRTPRSGGCGTSVLAHASGGWLNWTPRGGDRGTGVLTDFGGSRSTAAHNCGCDSTGGGWSTAAQGWLCGYDEEVGVGEVGRRIGEGVGGVGGGRRDWSLRSCVCRC